MKINILSVCLELHLRKLPANKYSFSNALNVIRLEARIYTYTLKSRFLYGGYISETTI